MPLTSAPSDAGLYKVTASIAEDQNYNRQSTAKTFEITQAPNTWITELSISGWIYGEAPSLPTAAPVFGKASFTYEDTAGYRYTEMPLKAAAGTWTVKASVTETDNYKGLTAEKPFVIEKAQAPEVILPDNLSSVQDSPLSSISLPEGWSWVNPQTLVSRKTSSYQAKLAVDGQNYDYKEVSGYQAEDGCVYRMLSMDVAQGKNSWILIPAIEDWIYGDASSAPSGKAAHGDIIFTYSASPTGTFSSQVPTAASTWYMKASVPVSEEYTGLNEIVKFTILKAISKYILPENLTVVYGQPLNNIPLTEGFAWADPSADTGDAGTRTFMAIYTPDDTENYETVTHIAIPVTVKKAGNSWKQLLSMQGWIYGQTANAPLASWKQ